MHLPAPLIPAVLLRRYKRFLADVRLEDGTEITVHCPNPGAMTGLTAEGSRVWLSLSANRARKLPHTLELMQVDGGLVGINTGHPNRVVETALAADEVPELAGYERVRREVRYGAASRIDLLLEGDGRPDCYVEIKNVHLMRAPGLAEFPDSVTARGARHLDELAAMVATGARAVMLYVVQREDCDRFALADDIDPAYAAAFERARAAGVEACVYGCSLSLTEIRLTSRLPFATAANRDIATIRERAR
ncbi:DNA/RNA nuclease SfsA [Amorphus orientalis]|uniref:Sugar fermentation stimulation protein homolog n=1 Tax=Amorphus orientalis TaxID=649198 RepID=A0AAE4ARV8_9HYPH|nr:DNA/RNA nuclease SfsA [Amorphus orientalis]MDQ0315536.1 sugar fermentation stimulation protein A [Amorphus orientalis]